jgi:hypothetical protein
MSLAAVHQLCSHLVGAAAARWLWRWRLYAQEAAYQSRINDDMQMVTDPVEKLRVDSEDANRRRTIGIRQQLDPSGMSLSGLAGER